MPLPAVEIVEVAPRDGLQNEDRPISAPDKIALIARCAQMGARRIEVGSYVDGRRVPQMAGTEEVVAGLPKRGARNYSAIALCLNARGLARAIAGRSDGVSGVDEAGCVLVATDSFGLRNQGQTVAEALSVNADMIRLARENGLRAQVTVAAAFGCPFEGAVDPGLVVDLVRRLVDAGAEEVALADTIGVAVPGQIGDLCASVIDKAPPGFPVRVHLHDTRGLAPANAWAAYGAGVRLFDASLGGLGGCPFAPGSAGNVATEELAYLFGHSKVSSNIDLDAALAANRWFAGVIGRPLPSRVGRAGDYPADGAGRRQAA